MGVMLFKDGRWKKFDEYSFLDRMKEGWSLSREEAVVGAKTEAPKEASSSGDHDFSGMTKKQLEAYARGVEGKNGKPIELDRRMNKNNMIKAFNEMKG